VVDIDTDGQPLIQAVLNLVVSRLFVEVDPPTN